MPRCPSCNKFVSLDTEGDPEIDNLEVSDDGLMVTCEVRITNTCVECSDELTEANFELEVTEDEDPIIHKDTCREEDRKYDVTEAGFDRTTRQQGKGRGAKTFYGVEVDYTLKCLNCEATYDGSLSDEIQASHMDELA